MKLSASQAAKEAGVSVPTISRAIKSGKISAQKTESGGYLIDPAELFRVFPPVTSETPRKGDALGTETPNESGVLQVEVKLLREALERERAMLEDVRTDRDHWREQAERATRLLAPPVTAERPRRSWWPFRRSND